jgi:hypothetical protein
MKKFDWLKYFFENKTESALVSVSEIVPDEFDEYYLLHWNVGIVDNFPFSEYPENNETIEETNKRIKIEREHNLFLNSDENKLFRKTNLKEISEIFKTEYSYQTLDKIKKTPAIKILDEISIKNLQTLTEQISHNQTLNLYVEDFFRYPNHDIPKQEIENITIRQYFDLQKDLYFDYWSYLFPDDKSWCISTAEDLPMVLCIKRELRESLKNNGDIEMFKVDYSETLYG